MLLFAGKELQDNDTLEDYGLLEYNMQHEVRQTSQL